MLIESDSVHLRSTILNEDSALVLGADLEQLLAKVVCERIYIEAKLVHAEENDKCRG